MRMAVSLEDGLGLDGDWCISVIPQHQPSVGESPQISHLQIELNYLNLLKTYCIFSDLGVPPLGWMWVSGWRCGWVRNRIEKIGFVL